MASYSQFDSNILPNYDEYFKYNFDFSNLKLSQYNYPSVKDNKHFSLLINASLPCILSSVPLLQIQFLLMKLYNYLNRAYKGNR